MTIPMIGPLFRSLLLLFVLSVPTGLLADQSTPEIKSKDTQSILTGITVDCSERLTARNSPTLHRLVCERKLRIGVRGDYPRFAQVTTQEYGPAKPFGYEIDLAIELGKVLGVDIDWVTVTPANRLRLLQTGQIDITIATTAHTSARDHLARFLKTHYFASQTMIVGRKTDALPPGESLRGARVCINSGNYAISTLSAESVRLVLYSSADDLLQALEAGICRFAAQDDARLESWLNTPGIAAEFEPKKMLLEAPWGIAVAPAVPDGVVDILDKALRDLHRSGALLDAARRHDIPTSYLKAQKAKWSSRECIAAPQECITPPITLLQLLRVRLMSGNHARYAGLFAAESLGLYAEQNLRVQLREGTPGQNPLEDLSNGSADVAVAWLGDALYHDATRNRVTHISQMIVDALTQVACRKSAGITILPDITSARVGVFDLAETTNLRLWLKANGINPSSVRFVQQRREDITNFRRSALDCVTLLDPADYTRLLDSTPTSDISIFQLSLAAGALPEDGLYVSPETLHDPDMRATLARFLSATFDGWSSLRADPYALSSITPLIGNDLSLPIATSAIQNVQAAMRSDDTLGLMSPRHLTNSWEALRDLEADEAGLPVNTRVPAAAFLTQDIWYESQPSKDRFMQPRFGTLEYLAMTTASLWFYVFGIFGVLFYGTSGFLRARERGYDIFGTFVCVLLPPFGGGTVRDLLVGNPDQPPQILNDPLNIALVALIVGFGLVGNRLFGSASRLQPVYERFAFASDTLGLAFLTVIGTQVALLAGLHWIMAPLCAALTCAGGGMFLDIVTGREPAAFKGEIYEEIAMVGSLFMLLMLEAVDQFEGYPFLVPVVILLTVMFVVTLRIVVVKKGLRFNDAAGLRPPSS